METSFYQLFKIYLMQYLPLSKDAIHVYIGLSVYFVTGISTKRLATVWPVLAVLILSLLMECFDLRDDLSAYGQFRWSASLHDIVNTLFWPVIITLILRPSRKHHPLNPDATPKNKSSCKAGD